MRLDRRTFIRLGALAGAATLVHAADAPAPAATGALPAPPTPPEIEGPFYPLVAQKDRDFDLTLIEGHRERAAGEHVHIEGTVRDERGRPVPDATIDLWQANTHGRYRHSHDRNPAPLDAHFQGWAVVPSGSDGAFRFRTVVPGAYPASPTWTRPPHIHLKVAKAGYLELVTQMYFPGHPLNGRDHLLLRKTADERTRMIATDAGIGGDGLRIFRFAVVIERIG